MSMAKICSKGDKGMIAWIKNLLTEKPKITVEAFEKARSRYQAKEDEINQLVVYSGSFCPVVKDYGQDISGKYIHNFVLNVAINHRIIVLRKEQEELLV
jgi:hypothetical protein